MRDGLAVSLFGHAALLVWALLSLPSPKALDASTVEAIPINFVKIADVTSVPKGVETPPKPVEKPKPNPDAIAKAIAEQTPPLPTPPEPKPPEPAPVPPPPPTPPEPTPPKPAPPEPTPPEPAPPEPAPKPAPAPEPAAKPEPPPPETPPPAPEPPPAETVKIQPKPDNMPLPVPRPNMVAQALPAKTKPDAFNPDKIAALLNKDSAPAEPQKQEPTVGGTAPLIDAQMTATELDALRARLAECWSPPIGWTDPKEVRVVLMLSLNPDGSVNGEPQVLERPAGRYEQTAPESALRAVRRCAPYTLPPEKYESWKQVRITFDPTEMGGG